MVSLRKAPSLFSYLKFIKVDLVIYISSDRYADLPGYDLDKLRKQIQRAETGAEGNALISLLLSYPYNVEEKVNLLYAEHHLVHLVLRTIC